MRVATLQQESRAKRSFDLTGPVTVIAFFAIIAMYWLLAYASGPGFWPNHPIFRAAVFFGLLGDVLNGIAVFANGGRMPTQQAERGNLQSAANLPSRFVQQVKQLNLSENVSSQLLREAQQQLQKMKPVRVPYLCKRYEKRLHRWQWTCSVGDVLIYVGILLLAVHAIRLL
jgi:hypothetical protein